MKKTLLTTAFLATTSFAAPTLEYSPVTVESGKTTVVSLDFKNDPTDTVYGLQVEIKFSLPSGVKITDVASSGGNYQCEFDSTVTANDRIIAIGADPLGGNELPDAKGICQISFEVPSSLSNGDIVSDTTSDGKIVFSDSNSNAITPVPTLSNITITGGATVTDYTVTVNTNPNGTVSCSPLTGPANTSVTCTATPDTDYSVDDWTNAECSGQGATCTFALTADTDVGATFKALDTDGDGTPDATDDDDDNDGVSDADEIAAGTDPKDSNSKPGMNKPNPTPVGSTSKPVPALGLFGLFGLLASVFGAAAMVLRRK